MGESVLLQFQVQKGPLGGNAAQWPENFCCNLKVCLCHLHLQAAVTESQISREFLDWETWLAWLSVENQAPVLHRRGGLTSLSVWHRGSSPSPVHLASRWFSASNSHANSAVRLCLTCVLAPVCIYLCAVYVYFLLRICVCVTSFSTSIPLRPRLLLR